MQFLKATVGPYLKLKKRLDRDVTGSYRMVNIRDNDLRVDVRQMNKEEFRDVFALRYNRHISNLPSKCPCGDRFDTSHAIDCKKGGFVNARHYSIREFETSLLRKVCTDVESEPHLLPVTTEILQGRSANTNISAEARLDFRGRGFWRRGQNAFIDVRVTNPTAILRLTLPFPLS